MRIRHINIRNFGQFHNKEYTFSKGLNVVYGGNESGKSTLHTFLIAMLFGMEKARGRAAKKDLYTQYEPWNSSSFYSGELDFEVGGKNFHLERNFYHKEKQSRLFNTEDGEQLFEEYGDLRMLLGGMTREVYENTHCITQTKAVPGKELAAYVQNAMANAVSTGDGELQVNLALAQLSKKRNRMAKLLKEESAKREHLLDKLQIEREILEEDIKRQRGRLKEEQEEQDTTDRAAFSEAGNARPKSRLGISALLCFLIAGCIFAGAWKSTLIPAAILTGLSAAVLILLLYRLDSRKRPKKQEVKNHKSEVQIELQEKQTRLFNVLEAQTELEEPSEREKELQQYLTAYELAGKTIQSLTGEIYEDFGEQINQKTSCILSELTDGRYDRVEISDKMEVMVYSQSRGCSPWQLSTGTLEQIYFSLRMSLGELMSKEEPMPFLLDETFLRYDEKRLKQALKWLAKQKHQVILFTCHKRELEYLEEMEIPFHKIELEGN